MEPYSFSPYGFTKLNQILDLHIRQVNRHLCRYVFTEKQYRQRRLPSTFKNYRFFIFGCLFDMGIVLGLSLSYFNKTAFFRKYNTVIKDSFNIKNPEKLSFSYLVIALGIIDAIYLTFYWAVLYKTRFLECIYELRAKLDRQITSEKVKQRFLRFFNLASFQTGINLKLSGIGQLYMIFYVIKHCFISLGEKQISSLDAFGIGIFFVGVQAEFYEVQYLVYVLLCGLFFVLKVFRYRTRTVMKTLRYMKDNSLRNYYRLNSFSRRLMDTHRLINYYNTQIREYNFVMDTIGKGAFGWSILNALKSPESFGILFLLLFAGLYFYSHFMAERMAFYKQMSPIMVQDLHIFCSNFSQQFPCSMKYSKEKKIIVLLRAEKMIDFLSSGNNRFGFTYAKQYHYTKYKVLENTLMFGYALMLIAKRSR